MKKLILSISLVAGAALVTHAQGTISINNYANTGAFNGQAFDGINGNPVYSASVTSGGLIFTLDPAAQAGTIGYSAANSQMLGADVNFALFGGATAGTATSLIFSLTGSAITGDNGNWGQLSDIAGNVYTVPGSAANSTVYLDLEVWEGSATTYAAAVAAGAYTGNTGVFANASGGGLSAPVSLTGMPDLQLSTATVVPEPSTLAMAGVGLASMLLLRRKVS
jgi:hypothetical protein